MKTREELINEFMEVFELLIAKTQETDQCCLTIIGANDITKQDLAIIAFVGKRGEVIMREVAEYLDIPYSTATGVIDKLVDKKLLKRVSSSTDRRKVKVCLTPKKGKEVYDQFTCFRHDLGATVLAPMDERDFQDMDRIMKKMVKQISNPVETETEEEEHS